MGNRLLYVCLISALAACGDDGGSTCGTGTTLMGGVCVANPGTECGPGTVLMDGQCVVDTTAPTCGPGTKLENNVCVIDHSAPDPVTGLAAEVSGTNINLSWTMGTGANGTIVARTVAGKYDAPAPGVTYMVGMTLPGGSTVVSVGNATTATDAFTVPGRYSYMAWSQNESGNLGFAREASTVAAIPAQNGVLTIDIAANTATVTTQPSNVALALADLAFDGGSGTMTVDLSATNNTAGHLFNVKAVVHTASVGTVTNATSTLANGDPFLTLGFAASVPAKTNTGTLSMSGITATSVITLNVEIIESGMAVAGPNLVDLLGGNAGPIDLPETRGNQHDSAFADGFPSASGRYFYLVTRWHPALFRVDTSDGSVSSVTPFVSGTATCVAVGADGYAYAAFQLGTHRARDGYGLGIAKIDPVSLTVVAKSETSGGDAGIGKGCGVNGSTFAASYGPFVFLANTATMQFIDADDTTSTVVDPVDSGSTDTIRELVFAPAGGTIYVTADKNDNTIFSINTTTFAAATYHTPTTARVSGLSIDAAGKLWWVSATGLSSYDGTTEATVPQGVEMTSLLGIVGNKAFVAADTDAADTFFTVDLTTGDATATGDLDGDRLAHRGIIFPTP